MHRALNAPLSAAPPDSFDVSFSTRVRPHLGRMLSTARRILKSDDLAWDAVQESLITLWLRSECATAPRAWLIRTVLHRSLHHARLLRRRRHHEERVYRVESDASADPAHVANQGELMRELDDALGDLSPSFREVLLLRERDDLDYSEIAALLRVPIGTVRSRINRARGALKTRLAQTHAFA
jgi:RNA polymerase sigma-70 factor (ECF subfamily)